MTKLSDFCDIIAGFAFKSGDFGSGSNKVIKITNIHPPIIDVDGADNVCHTPDKRFLLRQGDFVLAMTGATIGKVGYFHSTQENVYINQRTCKFIPKDGCDKDFLYYILNLGSFRKFIFNSVDSSSAQPNISHHTIGQFPFELPDIEQQKKVVAILKSIDKKIEINRQINDNLPTLDRSLAVATIHLAAY